MLDTACGNMLVLDMFGNITIGYHAHVQIPKDKVKKSPALSLCALCAVRCACVHIQASSSRVPTVDDTAQ